MKSEVRYGRVSSIDYEAGTCEVTYKDRDGSVTKQASFISNRRYVMPKVGDLILVEHPGTQPEDPLIVGTIWNAVNKPPEGFEGLFREDYDLEAGKCYFRYDANGPESLYHTEGDDYIEVAGNQETTVDKDRKDTTGGNLETAVTGDSKTKVGGNAEITVNGKLTLKVGSCTVTIDGGTVTVEGSTKLGMSAPTIEMSGTTLNISGTTVNISGSAGDCSIMGKSLVNHTHTSTAPGTQTTPPI